jgi:putative oxidoreductase
MTLAKLFFSNQQIHQSQNIFIRFTIALVMWPHGAQLFLGWFGGGGLQSSLSFLTEGAGLPFFLALLVIFVLFFGTFFILIGFLTRLMSAILFVVVVGMIFSGHLEHGFFMNWTGAQTGEGFEFHLLILGMCVFLTISGAAHYSVDSWIIKRVNTKSSFTETLTEGQ